MKSFLLIYLLSLMSAFSGELSFSGMENGDRIEITLKSSGCFHNTVNYYEVSRSADTSVFRKYEITWSEKIPKQVLEKNMVGEIPLDPKDIKGLDLLMKFYRAEKKVTSTTIDSLQVEYYQQKLRLHVEKIVDSSGAYGLEDIKGAVSFYELAKRLPQMDKK